MSRALLLLPTAFILVSCGQQSGSGEGSALPAVAPTSSIALVTPSSTTPVQVERLPDVTVDLDEVRLEPAGTYPVLDLTEFEQLAEVAQLDELFPPGESVRARLGGMDGWPEECLPIMTYSGDLSYTGDTAPDFSAPADAEALQDAVNQRAISQRRAALRLELCGELEAKRERERGDLLWDEPAKDVGPPPSTNPDTLVND